MACNDSCSANWLNPPAGRHSDRTHRLYGVQVPRAADRCRFEQATKFGRGHKDPQQGRHLARKRLVGLHRSFAHQLGFDRSHRRRHHGCAATLAQAHITGAGFAKTPRLGARGSCVVARLGSGRGCLIRGLGLHHGWHQRLAQHHPGDGIVRFADLRAQRAAGVRAYMGLRRWIVRRRIATAGPANCYGHSHAQYGRAAILMAAIVSGAKLAG